MKRERSPSPDPLRARVYTLEGQQLVVAPGIACSACAEPVTEASVCVCGKDWLCNSGLTDCLRSFALQDPSHCIFCASPLLPGVLLQAKGLVPDVASRLATSEAKRSIAAAAGGQRLFDCAGLDCPQVFVFEDAACGKGQCPSCS